MADYYSVLSSAVAHLQPNVETARRALYDRARQAVSERMRAIDVSEEDINAELGLLNAAVARIENEIAGPIEAALRARPLHPQKRVIPRSQLDDRPLPIAPVDQSGEAAPAARPIFSRRMLASIVAVLIGAAIAALGYAYLPRLRSTASQTPTPAQVASPRAGTAEARRQSTDSADAALPFMLARQLVYYRTTYPPGTLIIVKSQHFLYLVRDNEAALRYTIAVGPDCEGVTGLLTIAGKQGGPEPAASVISAADRPPTPARDAADGTPTLALADSTCRIRGTNVASIIGKNPPSGGFQLINDDMLDLYERVPVDTKVVVMN
jgi:lipoprotein-anchoring transpeptidase ErfK/SrfK